MAISLVAVMSIVALLIIVVISCVKDDLNVGFLAIGFAIIVASVWGDTSGAKVLNYFPTSLFMILVGVTFLFGMAQANGTMEKLTVYAVRASGGNIALMPLVVFVLVTIITAIGPGNIAGTALLAPVCMAIATRVGISAFLMTLIIVGAGNGAAFSPFAPAGIIANGLIAKMAPALGISPDLLDGIAWKIFFNSEIVQGFANIGGFFIMGGWAWIARQKGGNLNIDEFAPKPEPFDRHQILTMAMVVVLILMVIFPGLGPLKPFFNANLWLANMVSNVGTIAFILSGVLMLSGSGDSKAAIKVVPWGVIMMVCGVTVLIEVMDKAGGLNALVSIMASISNPVTINATLGLFTGIISAYSSSSGVVMPMFLPMVPGLVKELGGGDPIAMISSINIGAHLVDTSPLSTLGALCIACAGEHEDKAKLFRKLLIWGLSMSVVGATICYVFFGLLGL